MPHHTPQKRFALAPLLGVSLMLAALLAIVVPSFARAAEPGVVSDLSWGISSAQKQQTATAMTDAGVRWTRIGLGWHDMEPSKGSYSSWNLQDEDAAVAAARAAGVKVILDVIETPQWASGSTNKYAAPRNPQDLADFMSFIANRYKGQVQAYEIWNEENISRFWPSGPDAAAYTQLLKASYPAIKAADPSAQVVFGGVSTNDYHYIEAAYAAGAKGYFDVMGVHPYTCNSPDSASTSGGRISQYSYTGYREIHNSMVAAGDDKPIWFTEMGWSSASSGSCIVDEQTQANYLTRAYQIADQDPYVQVALWYNFREDYWSTSSSDYDGGFGMMHKDFTPKPAYYAFRDYATGASSTPPPDPAPAPPPDPAPAPAPAPDPTPPPPTNQAPTVALLKPVAGQDFTNALYLSASAGDDQGVSRVDFLVDGKLIKSDYGAPYTYNWKGTKKLSYGKHTVVAKAYDGDGLSAQDSTWVTRVR
ncbi:MAG: polysaccharide biosynthesis protein PslG [Solirubrobacterales bacterium]|jgi:hypothetical protein|nr:polysaccharide biosynthesis protein PslG [Solirubrobacterales bacterium]